MEFLVQKYFGNATNAEGAAIYNAMSVGNNSKSLESRTEILGGYCFFETPQSEKEQEKIMGSYSREN